MMKKRLTLEELATKVSQTLVDGTDDFQTMLASLEFAKRGVMLRALQILGDKGFERLMTQHSVFYLHLEAGEILVPPKEKL